MGNSRKTSIRKIQRVTQNNKHKTTIAREESEIPYFEASAHIDYTRHLKRPKSNKTNQTIQNCVS